MISSSGSTGDVRITSISPVEKPVSVRSISTSIEPSSPSSKWRISRSQPALTRDDMAFRISENWIGKAERFDRCAYLIDLALGMGAGIARIGNEFAHWTVGHGQPRRRFRCRYFVHAETPPKANDRRGFAPFENTIRSAQGEAGQVGASSGRGECRSS